MKDWRRLCEAMVEGQVRSRGVSEPAVLAALRRLPRHLFVPPEQRPHAYEDRPLPIGRGQTISQPYVVGYMSEALSVRPEHRVLEVGTGSGYQAAVLSLLAAEVVTFEVEPELSRRARRLCRRLGLGGLRFREGDAVARSAEEGGFDRVLVSAAFPELPGPLLERLRPDGLLLAPVGREREQTLLRVARRGGGFEREELIPVVFVASHRRPGEQA